MEDAGKALDDLDKQLMNENKISKKIKIIIAILIISNIYNL